MKAAIEALVSDVLRRRAPAPPMERPSSDDLAHDSQIQADALAQVARHSLGCEQTITPLARPRWWCASISRRSAAAFGHARIDGIDQPISAATARRMAADAELDPRRPRRSEPPARPRAGPLACSAGPSASPSASARRLRLVRPGRRLRRGAPHRLVGARRRPDRPRERGASSAVSATTWCTGMGGGIRATAGSVCGSSLRRMSIHARRRGSEDGPDSNRPAALSCVGARSAGAGVRVRQRGAAVGARGGVLRVGTARGWGAPSLAGVQITVLAGGVGGARFVRGVREECARRWPDGNGGTEASVTVVVNTGDDMWLAGLRLMPDLDTIMYALAGVNDTERGWGRAGETERVAAELRAWGVGWPWFTLGDLDLGTHIARTAWLREGAAAERGRRRACTARWPLGVRLLPATDAEVETHVPSPTPTSSTATRAALPGVVDALPRRAARRSRSCSGHRARDGRPRACSRRSSAPTSWCSRRRIRSSRSARSWRSPGIREALRTHRRARRRRLADHRRRGRARHGRRLPAGDRRRDDRRGGRAALRRAVARAACSTAGSSTRWMPPRSRALEAAGLGRGIRAAVDARPRHVGRARRRGDRPRGSASAPSGSTHAPPARRWRTSPGSARLARVLPIVVLGLGAALLSGVADWMAGVAARRIPVLGSRRIPVLVATTSGDRAIIDHRSSTVGTRSHTRPRGQAM